MTASLTAGLPGRATITCPFDSGYLIVRAVIDVIARRTSEQVTSRHVHVDAVHIDTAVRTVDVNGNLVELGRKEFDVLATLATDPAKVFSKQELTRRIWANSLQGTTSRTVDSHVHRVRRRLHDAGAKLVFNRHGAGWSLTSPAMNEHRTDPTPRGRSAAGT